MTQLKATDFYLISNASTDSHPQNTLTNFTNEFPRNSLSNDVCVEIGLDSIFFNGSFNNAPVINNNEPHIRMYQNVTGEITKSTAYKAIRLTLKDYTHDSLRNELNQHFVENGADINNLNLSMFNYRLDMEDAIHDFVNKRKQDNEGLYTVLENFRDKISDHNFFLLKISQDLNVVLAFHTKLADMMGYCFTDKTVKGRFNNETYIFLSESTLFTRTPKFNNSIPKYIKIMLTNIECTTINDQQEPIVSYHAINYVKDSMHYMNFVQPHFVKLTTNSINNFTVHILDDQNRQLQVEPAQSTIFKMSLRPYDYLKQQTTLIIDSTKENQYFPNNTKCDFSITLKPPIRLDTRYECALSSITLPTLFNSVPIIENESYVVFGKKNETKWFKIKLNFQKRYASLIDFLSDLNKFCYIPRVYPKALEYSLKSLNGQFIHFSLIKNQNNASHKIVVKGIKDVAYDFPREIGSLLGVTLDTPRWKIELDNEDNSESHFTTISVHPNINALIPNNLWLFAEFIEPTLVGGTMCNLLHIIPVTSTVLQSSENYSTVEFERLNWLEISKNVLDNISFQLRTASGSIVKFANPEDGIIFTLVLRRKELQYF
jgi:hypothetical protein